MGEKGARQPFGEKMKPQAHKGFGVFTPFLSVLTFILGVLTFVQKVTSVDTYQNKDSLIRQREREIKVIPYEG